jgi:reversibly glycosylated polypeptide/UDP-arabinopyranose mutase
LTAIVVVPNHLPHVDFLWEWEGRLDADIIVVQDGYDAPIVPEPFRERTTVHTWKAIEQDLGENAWIIPRRTSAVRSYGFYKAWQRGPSHILTLDNDCYPDSNLPWIDQHVANLGRVTTLGWVTGCEQLEFTRGYPYRIRHKNPVYLSHGLWSNVPDLDAPTSLHYPALRTNPAYSVRTVPRWNYFPMCGMNLAWRTDLTPAMYFGLFGPDYGMDQYDDIWAGVLVKKVLDHLGLAAVTGAPSVDHRKQSDVYANLRKQAPGLEMNENFWRAVDRIQLNPTQYDIRGAYIELVERLPDVIAGEPEGWTRKFKQAALIWAGLFNV